ncbi:MAG: hypothetical protein HC850_01250 [Rhodomicrobium sp.]|nr:hypothetical protein [Rhodomicrobium sp.]
MHKIRMMLAAAALGLAALFGGQITAVAAPAQTPLPLFAPLSSAGGLLEQVTWRGEFCWRHPHHWRCRRHGHYNYCRKWRWTCADRWGWHNWRYRRCLRRHGC